MTLDEAFQVLRGMDWESTAPFSDEERTAITEVAARYMRRELTAEQAAEFRGYDRSGGNP